MSASTTLTLSTSSAVLTSPTAISTTAASTSQLTTLDEALTSFLATWSLSSTFIFLLTLSFLLYPLIYPSDPDTHPFLLARQSQPAPIRQPGESAVYRALDVPHGYPLRNSLGVRDRGMAKWSPGRMGDVRDVWRVAVEGGVGVDGVAGADGENGKVGRLVTVRGKEEVVERGMGDVTAEVNAVGAWVKGRKKEEEEEARVAVCLSNSVELLVCVFAAAFYDFSVTLVPYGLSPEQTTSLLAQINADILITEAGSLEIERLQSSSKSTAHVVLVTRGGSQHMDWNGGMPQVTTWDQIVGSKGASKEVPPLDKQTKPQPLSIFCETGNGQYDLVEYTSENLVSGIAGLSATIARDNKLSQSDLLLPTTPLTDSYTLCWTLAALYANSSVAFNSVAGDNVDLRLCTQGIKPTIIIAAPGTINNYISDNSKSGGGPGMIGTYFANKSLQAGIMPTKRPTVALSPLSRLRLLLIDQPASRMPRLSSSTLHKLRLLLGSKVVYSLTAPKIAGAICQTNVHDYRDKGDGVSVGPPVGSVEVHMVGEEERLREATPQGRLVVKGPSVSGGKVELDAVVQVDIDHTLRLP